MTPICTSIIRRLFILATGLSVVYSISFAFPIAQDQDDNSRQIVLDRFTRARPVAASPKSQTSGVGSRRPSASAVVKGPRYTRKTAALSAELKSGFESMEIGVTIWRLRPSSAEDDRDARVLVMEKAQTKPWTPQRIEADTLLRIGERVRISIESPRAGYLYVIDREQYADGSLGDAYLIFPTNRTRGGDNQVRPGRLVEIPAQEDNPSYFTLVPTPGRKDQVAEVLSIIVTSEPLPNLPISDEPLRLSGSDVAKWERSWSNDVERFEMVGGAGTPWSKVEMQAGASASARLLTQEEPAPQTIYRVSARTKTAFMVTVPLRYGR
ncbi:MAG TPA: DUF4384 domain-containing protein [Pyrinomonadaceae bacterium]|nr:DUF4384 domain-containing protein [Pyrinomonadaceae bacterium]